MLEWGITLHSYGILTNLEQLKENMYKHRLTWVTELLMNLGVVKDIGIVLGD